MVGQQTPPEVAPSFCGAFKVKPARNEDDDAVSNFVTGYHVDLEGDAKEFFDKLYRRSLSDYPIPSIFESSDDGTKENPIRDIIHEIAFDSTDAERMEVSTTLAEKLASATPGQAKEGLFVVLTGVVGDESRVVLMRFPASQAIDLTGGEKPRLTVRMSYMKEHKWFKAAYYQDKESDAAFWTGAIHDSQGHDAESHHAKYWVEGFLQSSSLMTSKRGTRLLSDAIRDAIPKVADIALKENLIQSSRVLRTQGGMSTTFNEFVETHIQPDARDAVYAHVKSEALRDTPFEIKQSVVEKRLSKQVTEINDKEYVVIGPSHSSTNPNSSMKIQELENGQSRISITGKITGKRLR